MPNVERNIKIIKINHKNAENQINSFISTWKKIKVYQTKTFLVILVQEKNSLLTITALANNHLINLFIEEDLQLKEIHKKSHKIYTADQIVKIISIEITIQDQIQKETIIRASLKTVPIQTFIIDTIQMIEPETSYTIGVIIYSNNRNRHYQKKTDHETIQTIDQTIIDQFTIHRTEI